MSVLPLVGDLRAVGGEVGAAVPNALGVVTAPAPASAVVVAGVPDEWALLLVVVGPLVFGGLLGFARQESTDDGLVWGLGGAVAMGAVAYAALRAGAPVGLVGAGLAGGLFVAGGMAEKAASHGEAR